MYKNIEVLDKQKHEKLKYDQVDLTEVSRSIGIVPLGVHEVLDMSSFSPVLISAGDESELIAFTGISKDVTIYKKTNIFIPTFLRCYPFLSINIKNDKGTVDTVIAIDNNKDVVGKNKKTSIFNKKSELEKGANEKISQIRALNTQRDISRTIVKALKEKDLLVKKDFKIKLEDGERTILNEFYIVDRQKLLKLDDKTLAQWARKGWMGIIDAHLKSLNNFQRIF